MVTILVVSQVYNNNGSKILYRSCLTVHDVTKLKTTKSRGGVPEDVLSLKDTF